MSDVRNPPYHSPVQWPKVILYGDSLTQFGYTETGCWVSLLSAKLVRKCDVMNRGFSGYNSRWNDIMLPQLFTADNVKGTAAFVIFLGANDSNSYEHNPVQHVPVDKYKAHLITMVDYLQSVGVSKSSIILVSAPPCNEKAWAETAKQLHGKVSGKKNALTELYVKACQEAAQETQAHFVDTYFPILKEKNWTAFFDDGLHFSKTGSEFVFELIWPHVEKLTEHLPLLMPLWSDVDSLNPEKSLQRMVPSPL